MTDMGAPQSAPQLLERSTLRSFTVLALFCGNTALAGSESAAPGKVESIETSVCRLIESSARTQSLPVAFLTRLIWQESSFRPDTISPAGAQGIAQFMPKTADERGLANPFDPEEAIPKSAELLADLKQRFGNLGLAAAVTFITHGADGWLNTVVRGYLARRRCHEPALSVGA